MLRKGSVRQQTTESAHAPTSDPAAHTRAVGYVRVSTDIQATEGVSLDAQKEKLRAYCKLHEIELIRICCDEGISANTLERPGLQTALRKLEGEELGMYLLALRCDSASQYLRGGGAADFCSICFEFCWDLSSQLSAEFSTGSHLLFFRDFGV